MGKEIDLGSFHLIFKAATMNLVVNLRPQRPEKRLQFRGAADVDLDWSSGEIILQGKNPVAETDLSDALFLLQVIDESTARKELDEQQADDFSKTYFDPATAVGYIQVHEAEGGQWILHARVVLADPFFAGLWNDLMDGARTVTEMLLEVSWDGIGFLPGRGVWQDRQKILIGNGSFEFVPKPVEEPSEL